MSFFSQSDSLKKVQDSWTLWLVLVCLYLCYNQRLMKRVHSSITSGPVCGFCFPLNIFSEADEGSALASTFLRSVFSWPCVCVCCSEQCIEAYELLLVLAESEQGLVLGQFRAAGVSAVGKRHTHTRLNQDVPYTSVVIYTDSYKCYNPGVPKRFLSAEPFELK